MLTSLHKTYHHKYTILQSNTPRLDFLHKIKFNGPKTHNLSVYPIFLHTVGNKGEEKGKPPAVHIDGSKPERTTAYT